MAFSRACAQWLQNYDTPTSVGSKFRARRIAPLLRMIEAVSKKHHEVNLIDVGGRENYWNIIPDEYLNRHNVKITIVNLSYSEMQNTKGRFSFFEANGCDLSAFRNNSFHIAHANSVIEHVGDWRRMVQFAKEITRVSERYFIQTPNYWFPIELHSMTPFIHWLPKPTRIWLFSHFQLGHFEKSTSVDEAVQLVESARLLNKKMVQELFKDACLLTEKFLFLPKSFIAIKT